MFMSPKVSLCLPLSRLVNQRGMRGAISVSVRYLSAVVVGSSVDAFPMGCVVVAAALYLAPRCRL